MSVAPIAQQNHIMAPVMAPVAQTFAPMPPMQKSMQQQPFQYNNTSPFDHVLDVEEVAMGDAEAEVEAEIVVRHKLTISNPKEMCPHPTQPPQSHNNIRETLSHSPAHHQTVVPPQRTPTLLNGMQT
jgi:hypothetical protein